MKKPLLILTAGVVVAALGVFLAAAKHEITTGAVVTPHNSWSP